MNRRGFITLLGGVAAWPLAARAQQAGKLPMIGFIGADTTSWGPWSGAFVARLRELGWIEGRTVAIEYRWTEGRPERPAEFAAEFVRLNADIIITNSSSAPTVKQVTSTIPIVFVLGNEDAFETLVRDRIEALQIGVDSLFGNHVDQLVALATRHKVPTIYPRVHRSGRAHELRIEHPRRIPSSWRLHGADLERR